jgi:hypothetical protein
MATMREGKSSPTGRVAAGRARRSPLRAQVEPNRLDDLELGIRAFERDHEAGEFDAALDQLLDLDEAGWQ